MQAITEGHDWSSQNLLLWLQELGWMSQVQLEHLLEVNRCSEDNDQTKWIFEMPSLARLPPCIAYSLGRIVLKEKSYSWGDLCIDGQSQLAALIPGKSQQLVQGNPWAVFAKILQDFFADLKAQK
jgi:hypothetical protein